MVGVINMVHGLVCSGVEAILLSTCPWQKIVWGVAYEGVCVCTGEGGERGVGNNDSKYFNAWMFVLHHDIINDTGFCYLQ